jgi:hypothetical protein
MFNLNDITATARSNGFLVYNNNASKNILFIGTCRLGGLLYYYNNLNHPNIEKRNVYYIYIADWDGGRETLPKAQINSILTNTDKIVCENIKNYDILNTNELSEQSFFKKFSVSPEVSIYRLPNLDLYYHTQLLVNKFGLPLETNKLYMQFIESKERLMRSLQKYNASEIADFIEKYFSHIRLFYTWNHPAELLLLLLFKNLMKRMNVSLDLSFLERMIKIPILYGNNFPVYDIDVSLYKFTYKQQIETETHRIHDKNFFTQYPFYPQEITDELRTEWLQ